MALRRTVARPLACHGCQQWLLRSFIASIAGQSSSQPPSNLLSRRTFSRTSGRRDEDRTFARDEEHALNEINDEASNRSQPPPEAAPKRQTAETQLPWYLQVQQPLQAPETPLSHRQRIPDLPQHPPSLLEPLMTHVSVELGMDDLSLLDLRALEPPPALGANLLMIIGTARSEKHLHVSADRLCRWLRTEHKLSPYADGLLGRNELKLKMRRKAKRTRLLSAVGAKETADSEIDDGIRTGWVCVNVGRVPGGDLPVEGETGQEKREIVGFGAIAGGSNIVVQLMTEEKRGDVDLERLWTDMLNRSVREKEKIKEDESEADADGSEGVAVSEGESGVDSEGLPQQSSSRVYSHLAAPTSTPSIGQQVRAYHTSMRRMFATAAATTEHEPANVGLTASGDSTSIGPAQDPSLVSLRRLISGLKAMPRKRALEVLGEEFFHTSQQLSLNCSSPANVPEAEVADNPFLNSFYNSMPTSPGPEHWHLHIELLTHARRFGHPQMHSHILVAQLANIQISGLLPEQRTFALVLDSILSPLGTMLPYNGTIRTPNNGKVKLVLSVLESMEACGYDPVSPDILKPLHRAFIGVPEPSKPYELQAIVAELNIVRLRRHVQENDWDAFWRTWRSYPQRFLPRTAGMYAAVFGEIGKGEVKDTVELRDVLRTCMPEMEMEEPAIILAQQPGLAQAVMRALEFVDPELANGGQADSTEWREWYDECRNVAADAQGAAPE